MGCLHKQTPVVQTTETSESELQRKLAQMKSENFFGDDFENMLADYANDNELSSARELGMRTLYLVVRSGRLVPSGSA